MGFLVFLRTGEVLSLKIRQICFHDATATVSLLQTDSKGPHRSGVAEFVRASDHHCHATAAQTVRQMLQSVVKLEKGLPWAFGTVDLAFVCTSRLVACAQAAQLVISHLYATCTSRRIMGVGRWPARPASTSLRRQQV